MMQPLRNAVFSCVILFCGLNLSAQVAEIEAAVKAIASTVAVIDGHPAHDTLSVPSTNPGVIAAGSIHPDIKGYWHDGQLEKIVTKYTGEAGKKWEAAYYFAEGQLIYLNSEYATEMDYMGPGFYVVQYRNAHYLRDNEPFYRNFEGTDRDMPAAYKDVPVMRGYAQAYFKLLSAVYAD